MTATRAFRVLVAVLAATLAQTVHAGSTINVVVTVAYGSGPCGTAVTRQSVSVFCGPMPVLAAVGGGGGLDGQTSLRGAFGILAPAFVGFTGADVGGAPTPFTPARNPSPDEAGWGPVLPEIEPGFQRVGVLPASVTGHTALAVYSGGPNVSSWRMVSNDNVEHVELTISW